MIIIIAASAFYTAPESYSLHSTRVLQSPQHLSPTQHLSPIVAPPHESYSGTTAPESYTGTTAPESYSGTTAPESCTGTTAPESYSFTTAPDSYTGTTTPESCTVCASPASSLNTSYAVCSEQLIYCILRAPHILSAHHLRPLSTWVVLFLLQVQYTGSAQLVGLPRALQSVLTGDPNCCRAPHKVPGMPSFNQ